MLLAAAGSSEVNRLAAEWGRQKGALVNRADDRSACDFYFPALITSGETVVGVTSGGETIIWRPVWRGGSVGRFRR